MGYPILQAADIAIYKAHYVPVGEDQVPHIELTREIVRRFNSTYKPVFPEPEPILTPTPRILGIDGRKMSKRYDNGIYIADPPEEVKKKVMSYYTDPQRVRKTDPGHPERCPLFTLIKAFLPGEAEGRAEACRKGQIGCVECKRCTAEGLIKFLEPLRERREQVSDDDVVEILREGTKKAREEAQRTMEEVRRRMEAWRSVVGKMVEDVDARFRAILARIQGDGSVSLVGAEDIEEAGVEIRVGFRGAKPVPLDAYTQSGGERSAATVAFLLALQQHVKSPFRAIDEYDVHLDPVNRQRLAEAIISAVENSGVQYIVITPGPLPFAGKDVRVLTVQSVEGEAVVKLLRA